MVCPVVTSDGQVYERSAIKKWLKTNNTSPLTGLPLQDKTLRRVHLITRRNREADPDAFKEFDKERAAAAAAAKAKAEQNQKEVTLILSCGDAVDLMAKKAMMEVFDALQWKELKGEIFYYTNLKVELDHDKIIADPELCKEFLEFWGIALKRSLCLFYHCQYRWRTTTLRMDTMLDRALDYWKLSLTTDCHTYQLIELENMKFLVPVREAVHHIMVERFLRGCIYGYVDHKRNAYSMKLAEKHTNVLRVLSGRLEEGGVAYHLSSMHVIQTTSPHVPNADTTIFSLTGRTVCGNEIKQKFDDTPRRERTQSLGLSLQVASLFKNCELPVLAEEMFDQDSMNALNILSLHSTYTNVGLPDKRGTETFELVEFESVD